MKDHTPCSCQGNQAFYSIPVTDWLRLRSGVATGTRALGRPPADPPLSKGGVWAAPLLPFHPTPAGWHGTERALGLSGAPWLWARELGAPQALLWPGPSPRTIASKQGKIPSPRVQVSKELPGPLFSLEWALRSRCSCLACSPPPPSLAVLFLTPELPKIVFPSQWWERGEDRSGLCSLWGTNWERQAVWPAQSH